MKGILFHFLNPLAKEKMKMPIERAKTRKKNMGNINEIKLTISILRTNILYNGLKHILLQKAIILYYPSIMKSF